MFTVRRVTLVLLVFGIIGMLSGTGLVLYFRNATQTTEQTTVPNNVGIVSGTFNINGVIPEGATITLSKKLFGSQDEFEISEDSITPLDEGTWSIQGLQAGKSYEILAKIIKDDQTISFSSPITVSAPATNSVITIDLPLADPKDLAALSGTIRINGYIPQKSTIHIMGKKLGDKQFQTFIRNLPGQSRQNMNYTSAKKGQTYEIFGILYDQDSKEIGKSETLVLTAPASNETVTINSTAVETVSVIPTPTVFQTNITATPSATPTPVALSGSIKFNGIAPLDSRVVILQKRYNTTQYQVAVDNISPIDGTTWKWEGAQASTWYDVIAILKQRQSNGTDKDIAGSQVIPAAAPAGSLSLTINSSVSLSAPGGPITVTCNNLTGSTWNATVSFGTVTGAQTYWYQIGTTNGGTETANTVFAASSGLSTQSVTLSLSQGTSYYARYAYATVSGVPAGSTQFSPFTTTTQIQCN